MGKDEFLKYLQYEKRYSLKTVLSYGIDLEQFIEFQSQASGVIDPGSITDRQIRAWIVQLSDNGISPRSINRKITCLKSFFKYHQRIGTIDHNPVDKVTRLKQKKELPWFVDVNSTEALFSNVEFDDSYEGRRDFFILEILYATGIRLSELINIKIEDIDSSRGNLKVLGKRKKERIVPLSGRMFESINQYLNERNTLVTDNRYLFVTSKGKKLYEKLVYRICVKYLSMVTTIDKRSPHVMRHTFATHMLNNGADINIIKEILGHTNLSATQVYTHNSFEKLKNVYKKAHPRN